MKSTLHYVYTKNIYLKKGEHAIKGVKSGLFSIK